jgi:hypothetical protein
MGAAMVATVVNSGFCARFLRVTVAGTVDFAAFFCFVLFLSKEQTPP